MNKIQEAIEKIAKEKEKKRSLIKNIAVTGALAFGAKKLTGIPRSLLTKSFLNEKKNDNISNSDINKVMSHVHPDKKVTIQKSEDMVKHFNKEIDRDIPGKSFAKDLLKKHYNKQLTAKDNAYFIPLSKKTGFIGNNLSNINNKNSATLHEIGHSDRRSILGKAISGVGINSRLPLAILPTTALAAYYGLKKGEDKKYDNKLVKAGIGLGALASAGVLAEEARASLNANSYAKKLLGKKPIGLKRAFGTYTSALVGAPIVAGLAGYGVSKLLKKKETSKEATFSPRIAVKLQTAAKSMIGNKSHPNNLYAKKIKSKDGARYIMNDDHSANLVENLRDMKKPEAISDLKKWKASGKSKKINGY
jgi:hypothetical protein